MILIPTTHTHTCAHSHIHTTSSRVVSKQFPGELKKIFSFFSRGKKREREREREVKRKREKSRTNDGHSQRLISTHFHIQINAIPLFSPAFRKYDRTG